MAKEELQIVLVDSSKRPFPPARTLVDLGVPLSVAVRWEKMRRDITRGLRKRVREAMN